MRPALRGAARGVGWALRAGAAALGVDSDIGAKDGGGDGEDDNGEINKMTHKAIAPALHIFAQRFCGRSWCR